MLKVCVLFSHPGCLQTISPLRLLLLVLPLQTLLAVVEHATLEQIELGSTIPAALNDAAADSPALRRVRVRFLQQAHVLANEAAARAGRGQAIAPTQDDVAACA